MRWLIKSRINRINADPDEMGRNEPSHQDLCCLPFLSCYYTVCFFLVFFFFFVVVVFVYATSLFEIMNPSKFKDRRVHFRNSAVKGLRKFTWTVSACCFFFFFFFCEKVPTGSTTSCPNTPTSESVKAKNRRNNKTKMLSRVHECPTQSNPFQLSTFI